MSILVTAFGPFDGRSENASSLALRGLKAALPQIRTRVLPVDCVVAPARLRQALHTIRPEILILLGEAAGTLTIRLETTAFNELDFRIPDISGRYLCNQVLYIALDYLETHALPCRAGFIHLPLAADYPTNRAADALASVIRSL